MANSKTVAVQPSAGEDKAVVLSTSKTKKKDTHAKLLHKTLTRKQFCKMAKSVQNQVLTQQKFLLEKLECTCYACFYAATHLYVHLLLYTFNCFVDCTINI